MYVFGAEKSFTIRYDTIEEINVDFGEQLSNTLSYAIYNIRKDRPICNFPLPRIFSEGSRLWKSEV